MLRRRDPLANPEPLIRRVYSYAAYRLGDGPDAEDATSETIERALRYRQTYNSKAGTPQAWLLGIARRVVAEHERQSHMRPDSLAEDVAEARAGDDPSLASLERLLLREALATLSQDERDLLALRYGADLTAKDMAHILESRTNSVEVALHRTLAKLRTRMTPATPARDEAPVPTHATSLDDPSAS